MKRVAVIGAGIGGLATAIRAAAKGMQVTIYEKNNYTGGKLGEWTSHGYRFDTGPSLFTMPQYIEDLYSICGKDAAREFSYKSLDETCRYFWDDGQIFNAPSQPEIFAETASLEFGADKTSIKKHMDWAERTYNRVGRIFLEKPIHSLKTWIGKDALKAYLHLPSYSLLSTMNKKHNSVLKNEKLVQLFNRFATYNGSDPYRAPALLSMIPHLEHGVGSFLPEKGMRQIPDALTQLAMEAGIEIVLNADVSKIITDKYKAKGIKTNNQIIEYDYIVSNVDIFTTYNKLLPQIKQPTRILSGERSTSGVIFYWGIQKEFKKLGLHNIFFSNNYAKEFEHLQKGESIYMDPTIYINITSKHIPSDAPEGCENWFVLVNAPANTQNTNKENILKARQAVINKLNKVLNTNIESYIQTERTLDPVGIENETGTHRGALYGTASNTPFAAFFRHPNRHRNIKNLFFVGGSVHPGGGIPLCLNSARIVSQYLVK